PPQARTYPTAMTFFHASICPCFPISGYAGRNEEKETIMAVDTSPRSSTFTYVEGEWLVGTPPLIGPTSHAMWLGSTVFDGARWFDGIAPDLDLHCQRVNRSALALGLKPVVTA